MTMVTGNYQYSTTSPLANMTFLTAAKADMDNKEFKNICGQRATSMQIEKMIGWEGPGAAPSTDEGATPQSFSVVESYADTIRQTKYQLELPLTMEQQMFTLRNAGFVNVVSEMRARSIALSYEYGVASYYSNGFATNTTGDGVYAFSASHLWKIDGSTSSNLLTAATFSKTGLEDAIIQIAQQEIENDIRVKIMPTEIRYGTQYIMTIKEVLKSVKDPDSANNTYNPVTDWNLKPVMNRFLNANDWFVSCATNSSEEFVQVLQSKAPTFYQDKQESGAQNIILGALCLFGVGYEHSRFVKLYGNAGS